MTTLDLPSYLVEMNVSSATNAWILGLSALGSGTILLTSTISNAFFTAIPNMLSAKITRGRDDELGQVQAGSLTIVLDNGQGQFSPDNAASPYYPNVVPMRQIRLSARYSASAPWSPLFYGYVQSITPQDNGPLDSNVTITATDWLGKAAIVNSIDVRAAETDQARFTAMATLMGTDGLPLALVGPSVDAESLVAKTYNEYYLQAFQEMTDVSRGVIYHARDGTITYRTRSGRWTTPGAFATNGYYFSQPSFDPSAFVVPYLEPLDYALDTRYLYNDIQVTGADNVVQETQDSTSQLRYSRRTLLVSAPVISGSRAAQLATYLLAIYKTPAPRVHSIVVDGDAWATGGTVPLWDTLFGIELGDTVRIVKYQPGNLAINRTMFVEGLSHDIVAKDHHTITLKTVDRAYYGPQPWMLGTSQLNVNTTFAY